MVRMTHGFKIRWDIVLVVLSSKLATVYKKIKKLCLTSRFETDNISSVELLLRQNK